MSNKVSTKKAPGTVSAFQRRVSEIREGISKTLRAGLQLHYDIGCFYQELRSDPDKWGGHHADELAGELGRSVSLIRRCAQMAAFYSQEQIDELKKEAVSWTSMTLLVSIKDDEKRGEITKQVIEGDLSRHVDLKKEVEKIKYEEKLQGTDIADVLQQSDGRGVSSPSKAFSKISSVLDDLILPTQRAVNFVIEIQALDKVTDKKKYDAAINKLAELINKLVAFGEAAKELFKVSKKVL